jgi:hypothetical protein
MGGFMRLVLLALLFVVLPTGFLLAAEPFTVQCKVEEILDGGDYENENDFTFDEYPNLIYSNDGQGRLSLLLGAMEYSTDKENNLDIPYTFDVSVDDLGVTTIEAYTNENDDHVVFAYDDQGLLASFKGKPVAFCHLDTEVKTKALDPSDKGKVYDYLEKQSKDVTSSLHRQINDLKRYNQIPEQARFILNGPDFFSVRKNQEHFECRDGECRFYERNLFTQMSELRLEKRQGHGGSIQAWLTTVFVSLTRIWQTQPDGSGRVLLSETIEVTNVLFL